MRKIIGTTCLLLFMLLELAACGNNSEPMMLTSDKVIQDVEGSAHNIYLGIAKGNDEKFLLSSLIIDDSEVTMTKRKEKLDVKITAFIGDSKWRSEAEQTIIAHYGLDKSRQWVYEGLSVKDPVIPVELRSAIAE
ncbi:hypothetical protein [Paenibacillus sp. YAF4_2]|uniref:hypothetical protein n=1 Tax=Paenibacillus sp. YAF4_2 TaxID=3233085 RepID=UPI003F9A2F36